MNIQEERHGAVMVIKPNGPITQAEAADFKAIAQRTWDTQLGRFLIDLSATPYVDSQGLEALLDISEQMGTGGQALKLCAANKTLREVFTLTGLAPLFEQYDDVNSGVRSFL
jgi:anti-anti-sigma factor